MSQPTLDDGTPVFGVTGNLAATRPFAVEVYHVPTQATEQWHFTAWVDPGAGPILAFLRAQTEAAEMNAAAGLLFNALVDDDGLPESYLPPPDADVDPRLHDRDEWSSRRRFTWLMDAATGEYRIAGNVIVELAKWIAQGAFTRGALTTEAGPGPTAAPARSSRGRTSTRRGSTGKRSTAI